jgi:hypothetical protein
VGAKISFFDDLRLDPQYGVAEEGRDSPDGILTIEASLRDVGGRYAMEGRIALVVVVTANLWSLTGRWTFETSRRRGPCLGASLRLSLYDNGQERETADDGEPHCRTVPGDCERGYALRGQR